MNPSASKLAGKKEFGLSFQPNSWASLHEKLGSKFVLFSLI
jgi:hypothetical protein